MVLYSNSRSLYNTTRPNLTPVFPTIVLVLPLIRGRTLPIPFPLVIPLHFQLWLTLLLQLHVHESSRLQLLRRVRMTLM